MDGKGKRALRLDRRAVSLSAAIAAAIMVFPNGVAMAATGDCTQITNFASATFVTTAAAGVEVSYAVTAAVIISSPNVFVGKTASPTLQGSGGTVTFCITVQNVSYCASAFDVTIADRLPDGMNYVGGVVTPWDNGVTTWSQDYATIGAPNTWVLGTAPANPPGATGPYYLRWVADQMSPRESAVICYTAVVQ